MSLKEEDRKVLVMLELEKAEKLNQSLFHFFILAQRFRSLISAQRISLP